MTMVFVVREKGKNHDTVYRRNLCRYRMDDGHGGTDGRKGGIMGKYIIEIPDDMIVSRELPTLAIKARFGNMRQFALDTGLKLMPYDDAEQRGADKAWELARWCFKDASDSDLERAFPFEWNHGGYRRIADMPYIQAAGRYEAWQKQKEENAEIAEAKKEVLAIANKIGIHALYAMVLEIRGE